ncbi:MAG: FkbM family methyltransferase [Terriglobia bacterium]
MVRRVLERLTRGLVLRRRLPARFGGDPIFVSPDARLGFLRWDLERAADGLFGWAEEFVQPGDVVWDVGANVGLFTFAAASRSGPTGQVVALEADTWLVGLLRRSAALQSSQRARVDVVPVAVGERVGIARFNIAARGRAANFLESARGSSQTGGIRQTVSVMSVTLDWLLERLPAPRVLKIDVEGGDLAVLRGAERILSGVQPIILVEVGRAISQAVSELLHAHGYTLFDLENRHLGPIERASYNTLARPANRG